MSASITINSNVSGRTLQEFAKLLDARQKYLEESTEQSVMALAENVLTSLRKVTKVFKASHLKVEGLSQDQSLEVSYYRTKGTKKSIPVLRKGKSRYIKGQGERIKWPKENLDTKFKVFRWDYPTKKGVIHYIIVARNDTQAIKVCKEIQLRRAQIYAGLARSAISQLMRKAYVGSPIDTLTNRAKEAAERNTRVSTSVNAGLYKMSLRDELLYAISALKNGEQDVELAFQKALNKIASVINQKCKGLVSFDKLDTPFPEIKQRRG